MINATSTSTSITHLGGKIWITIFDVFVFSYVYVWRISQHPTAKRKYAARLRATYIVPFRHADVILQLQLAFGMLAVGSWRYRKSGKLKLDMKLTYLPYKTFKPTPLSDGCHAVILFMIFQTTGRLQTRTTIYEYCVPV